MIKLDPDTCYTCIDPEVAGLVLANTGPKTLYVCYSAKAIKISDRRPIAYRVKKIRGSIDKASVT